MFTTIVQIDGIFCSFQRCSKPSSDLPYWDGNFGIFTLLKRLKKSCQLATKSHTTICTSTKSSGLHQLLEIDQNNSDFQSKVKSYLKVLIWNQWFQRKSMVCFGKGKLMLFLLVHTSSEVILFNSVTIFRNRDPSLLIWYVATKVMVAAVW